LRCTLGTLSEPGSVLQHTSQHLMRTIAVTNQKGGSGKTTTAVNLAAALGEMGKRILVVDLDPQASATSWLGTTPDGRGLYDVIADRKPLERLVVAATAPGVDLVPSSPWLVGAERTLTQKPGSEVLLRQAVQQLPARWDFVLVDCPPSLGYLAVSALAACREVLVTVEAHVMAMAGLAALLQTVERVHERLNPELAVSAILAVRVNRTTHSRDVVERLRKRFGDLVLTATVRENVRLAEAPSFQAPITKYAPTSIGAEDYRAVAVEFAGRRAPRPRRQPA